MLNSITRRFDYSGFEKKLKHYFMDSAPINADVDIGLREVRVSCQFKPPVSCVIDETLSVERNIKNLISACVENIYPKMIVSEPATVPFTDGQKRALLLQGFSVGQIHEKERRRNWIRYIIIRFNERGSSLDYVEEVSGVRYRARLYQPLMLVRDKIWKLASGGREGMEELYRFLMSASKQEILENQNGDGECSIQES
jgi:hypothetical protein